MSEKNSAWQHFFAWKFRASQIRWKFRAKRGSIETCGARAEEVHFAEYATDPNFTSAGIKIKAHLFTDFLCRITWRNHFDTKFRRLGETRAVAEFLPSLRRSPRNIDASHSVRCGDGTFRNHFAIRHQVREKCDNLALKTAMSWRWRRAHNDATMSVGFNTSFDFPQFWVGQNFFPAAKIKCRLLISRAKF